MFSIRIASLPASLLRDRRCCSSALSGRPRRRLDEAFFEASTATLVAVDLAFFLLSKDYVTACELPFHVSNSATQIFLIAPSLEETNPVDRPYIHAVCAGEALVNQLPGASKHNLKGVVFERLCRKISTAACDCGIRVLEEVKQNPQRIKEFIL